MFPTGGPVHAMALSRFGQTNRAVDPFLTYKVVLAVSTNIKNNNKLSVERP